MKRNNILKKIRKATRKNRVQAFEYFWEEVTKMGFFKRWELCWTILWYRREKREIRLVAQPPASKIPSEDPS